MACSSVTMPTSQTATQFHNDLRRSDSSKDLRNQANMRRCYSEGHLCKSMNCVRASSVQPKMKTSRSFGFPFEIAGSFIPRSVRTLLFDPETSRMSSVEDGELASEVGSSDQGGEFGGDEEVKRVNWVERLLEIRSHWRNRQAKDNMGDESYMDETHDCYGDDEDGCLADYDSEEGDDEEEFDCEMFYELLKRVPWSDTKLFSRLAFLCNMAYVISDIKPNDLKRHYGLNFVTSSLEKKAELAAIKAKLDEDSKCVPAIAEHTGEEAENTEQKRAVCPEVAYGIAASAASYVQSRAKEAHQDISGSNQDRHEQLDKEGESSPRVYKSEVAATFAASTMTAVVAAGEEEKQETAKDLQSLQSSPCEWFVCDDLGTYTRCFVIQGSDSFASWQANLFFEPAKFEGTDVLVHRGIYEAAKGIYDQYMPEIISHLERYGDRAKLQFTGHSLGGSLSLLIHLMLLTRKVVKPSTLRPVITFGSPFIFCGGHKVLNTLGLDENHIHNVMMHRDIVPRAFSCNYPDHVAVLLKRLNGTFRSHPCLNKQKMLYSPLGKIFILQPEEESSPSHPLLPSGSALYTFDDSKSGKSSKRAALKAFLNRPHPLETLSNPTAYGSDGTILRDHDSGNYLKALHGLVRQNTKTLAWKAIKQQQDKVLWPLLKAPSPHSWDQHDNLSNDFDSGLPLNKEVMTRV
ncbi:Phospholipase A1 PLIP1, chloroplastic [Linum perenne]